MSFGQRLSYAFRTFFSILSGGSIPSDIAKELVPQLPPPPPPPPVRIEKLRDDPGDRAVQILALMQRDGRLIDFLTEDISPFSDAQIGAAVRDIHQSCKKTLETYFTLEPVFTEKEGHSVTVENGSDIAAIKLFGNGKGKLPAKGVIRHRGWRVTTINLPPLPEGTGRMVLAQAEVETQG
ncbi:MAG: DUF2760 domain-containing protein [Blastocatellia bacterium]|nr:DUF2760 domain-containing protein [Blastocatellia bacterium]